MPTDNRSLEKIRRIASMTIQTTKKNSGFTLIELMVAVMVLAIVMTFVVGSFGEMLERQHFQAAAENLYDNLLFARTESINRNTDVYITVKSGSGWCYGLDDTGSCDCSVANDCKVNNVTKVINGTDYHHIQMSGATFAQPGDNYIVFNPRRGMPEDNSGILRTGAISFVTSGNDNLTVQVNPVGRIRVCTSTGYRGYTSC